MCVVEERYSYVMLISFILVKFIALNLSFLVRLPILLSFVTMNVRSL